MKKLFTPLPYLFAMTNILFLFSYNVNQISFTEIIIPSSLILIFTFLLVLLSELIFRNDRKTNIFVTIALFFFFFYGHIFNLIEDWQIRDFVVGKNKYLLIIWGVLFTSAIYLLYKTHNNLENITKLLYGVAISSIIISLVNITVYQFKTIRIDQFEINILKDDVKKQNKLIDLSEMRDIYYIILDGYASTSTLNEFYNYNNNNFTDYLSDKGFYVASKSLSNYVLSPLSLASSLNMEYLTHLTVKMGVDSEDRSILYQMIKNNKVIQSLKLKGYKFIHFSSGWGPTNGNKLADYDINTAIGNEFIWVLVQTTMIKAFSHFGLIKDQEIKRRLDTFDQLGKIHKIEGPKFTFAHIMCPHPPFLFNANGTPVPGARIEMDGDIWSEKTNYLNQLTFVNNKVIMMVDKILSKSEISPIIIIQADHGPASTFVKDGWGHPTENMINERTKILNAYYLPSVEDSLLYDSITPVNTFRLIFNLYFNTSYELLDDHSYWSTGGYDHPYTFLNVTKRVKHD